jgi:hypothetical protein
MIEMINRSTLESVVRSLWGGIARPCRGWSSRDADLLVHDFGTSVDLVAAELPLLRLICRLMIEIVFDALESAVIMAALVGRR